MAIALLTDFGDADYFAGAMKGVILSIDPDATIVDITHSIPRHDVARAAFCLGACYRDFPTGTVFVCVVDPGVGSERRGIAVSADGRQFVAPDNGILSSVLQADPAAVIVELENPKYLLKNISRTFHGRDVFAPVAAHLSQGADIGDLGPVLGNPVLLEFDESEQVSDKKISGSIIHIDGFGNLVTNISVAELGRIDALEIAGRKITRHVKCYSEAPPETLFFIAGSAGFIEICIFEKSAAEHLGSMVSDPLDAHLNTRDSQ